MSPEHSRGQHRADHLGCLEGEILAGENEEGTPGLLCSVQEYGLPSRELSVEILPNHVLTVGLLVAGGRSEGGQVEGDEGRGQEEEREGHAGDDDGGEGVPAHQNDGDDVTESEWF